jgi:CheY-like chemotaxis protein
MQKTKVLVVDDDEAVRLVTSEMLKHMDCEVDSANGGREALACLDDANYDLVLLDVGMPIMSGTEVYAAIRASLPEQPVVFVTGYSEQDVAELTNSRTLVLAKPFTLQELRDTVDALLAH